MAPGRKKATAGRAAGLAVALGVGAAIACAGPAWADDAADSGTASAARASGTTEGQDNGREQAGSATEREAATRPQRSPGTQRSAGTQRDTEDRTATEDAEDAETTDDSGDPAEVRVRVTRPAAATVPSAPATPDDSPPAAAPTVWSLLGTARRPAENDVAVPEPSAETSVALAPPPQEPDWESLYTGEPSPVHELVTVGLNVIQAVLKPFGGLLAFTSLRIPFITDPTPPFFLTAGLDVERSEFDGMPVWSLTRREDPGEDVIVALHGGAYVAEVSVFHWWTYTDMARDTGATVVVPIYDLVPVGTAATEVPRTASFVTQLIDDHGAANVTLLGDSAGGGMAMAVAQELVRRRSPNPARLVLLAPWLDVSMSDPRSAEIRDPLLDIPNLVRAGEQWAGGADHTTDPLASPLFGSLDGLPPMYVYSSSRDMLTADTLRLRDRVLAEDVPGVTFRLRKGLIHDWATFPFLPDAHEDRARIYADLLGTDTPINAARQ